jgi:hypothetical protein
VLLQLGKDKCRQAKERSFAEEDPHSIRVLYLKCDRRTEQGKGENYEFARMGADSQASGEKCLCVRTWGGWQAHFLFGPHPTCSIQLYILDMQMDTFRPFLIGDLLEWFGKKVSRILDTRDVMYINDFLVDAGANEMSTDVDMFHLGV